MKWSLSRSTTITLLLSPVGILLISITRLLIVSNYSAATASTIASSGGYIDTLLGTLIPLVPIFMPLLALVLLFLNRTILAALALSAAALISPTDLSKPDVLSVVEQNKHLLLSNHATMTAIGWLGALLLLALAFQVMTLPIAEFVGTVSTIISLALVPLVLTLYSFPLHPIFYKQQLRQPWLPAEVITLNSGQNLVAYVLARDNDWFVVLIERDRTVDYIKAGQVIGQAVCQIGATNTGSPLITLFNVPPVVPICPP
jgi:hypothetical protein